MHLRRLFLAAAAALAIAAPGVALATVMREASVPQLAHDAEVVARGRVAKTESRVSGDGMRLFTVVTLDVAEAWKGAPGKTVQIQVPGGSRNGIGQIVQGAPQFREGEDVVVFLRGPGARASTARAPQVPLRVVAMAQGKFEVARDEAGAEVAAPNLEGVELVQPGTNEVRAAVRPAPIRVDELKRQVKAAAP